MKSISKLFDWGMFKIAKCTFGVLLLSVAVNLFIVPNNLYTGGFLGIAQLIRSFLISTFGIKFNFDISSVIYYILNVPLFIIAYKEISKTFFVRTLFCVTINTIFLALIPVPENPLIPELIGNVLIGGTVGGIGIGMVLSTGASTGGTDIIGIFLSKKNRNYSVGNIGLVFNVIVYGISGIIYGIETMIYSIIYSVFDTIMIDRTHQQNICSEAFIFTRENPDAMISYISNVLNRDATYWEATGGYTKSKIFIVYSVLSKYERMRLERHMKEFDERAFMVSDDGVEIKGKFDKYLN